MWPSGGGLLRCQLGVVERRGRLNMCLFLADVNSEYSATVGDDKPCNVN